MKIKVIVSTDKVGSQVSKIIDVDDEATDQEISEEINEFILSGNMIEIDWQRA